LKSGNESATFIGSSDTATDTGAAVSTYLAHLARCARTRDAREERVPFW
jgi:hypothetical protein